LASRLRANEYLWLRRNRRPASIDEKLVGKLLRDTLLRVNLRARFRHPSAALVGDRVYSRLFRPAAIAIGE